jgi:hypothetical protein
MPVFVIKAKDALAVPAMRAYLEQCEEHGLSSQAYQVKLAIQEVLRWQGNNIDATKLPDHKHVPTSA